MKSNDRILNDIYIHKEYNIKNEKEIYNLRIEIDNINIYFKLKKLNESIDYIYKNKFKIISFINILELNQNKYSNSELIFKIFDKLYNKNSIIIDDINEDNINLKIKYSILYDDIEKEIQLYKEYMNINDKINIMYNQFKLLNNNNNFKLKNDNKEIEKMRKEINELKLNQKQNGNDNDINLKDNIINEIINKKIDKIINNFKNEFNDKDKKIKELNNKIISQENEIKNKNKEIELINKTLKNINKVLNDYQNNINNLNQKLEEINNNNINNKKEKFFNDKIKEEKENIINNINNKYNDLKEKINNKIDINELDKLNKYKSNINYKLSKEEKLSEEKTFEEKPLEEIMTNEISIAVDKKPSEEKPNEEHPTEEEPKEEKKRGRKKKKNIKAYKNLVDNITTSLKGDKNQKVNKEEEK